MKNLYDFRSFQRSKHIRFLCLAVFGALYSFQVAAQVFPSSSSGNTTTYGGGTYNAAAVAGGAAVVVAGGAAVIAQNKAIRTAAGVAVGVAVRAIPAAGAIRGALAACLNSPACAVATAAAAAALANEIGYTYGVDPSGAPVIAKAVGSGCTVALGNGRSFTSPDGICLNALKMHIADGGITAQHELNCPRTVSNPSAPCQFKGTEWWMSWNDAPTSFPQPSPGATQPATVAEFSEAVENKKDYQPDSKAPAVITEAVKAGNPVDVHVPSVTVTGPASVAKAPTTTTKADGTTVTSTGSIDLRYYGPSGAATEKTVETTTTPQGVSTTTNTTVAPTTNIQETPDACATNPNSNGCRTDEFDTPAGEIPKTTKAITFAAENLGFAGGSCPANVVQNLKGKQLTVVNWSQNCTYITTYVKPMFLALATFAALLIIFGGKPE